MLVGFSKRRTPSSATCSPSTVYFHAVSGKSSLLNAIFGKGNSQRAKASSRAGRTTAVEVFRVNDGLLLADVPGHPGDTVAGGPAPQRAAEWPKSWGPLVRDYLEHCAPPPSGDGGGGGGDGGDGQGGGKGLPLLHGLLFLHDIRCGKETRHRNRCIAFARQWSTDDTGFPMSVNALLLSSLGGGVCWWPLRPLPRLIPGPAVAPPYSRWSCSEEDRALLSFARDTLRLPTLLVLTKVPPSDLFRQSLTPWAPGAPVCLAG